MIVAGATGQPSCPRCGAEMLRRLDEYECSKCGYFASAEKILGATSDAPTEPSSVARRISEAGFTLPGADAKSRPGLYALDAPRVTFLARWMKVLFLIILFLETVGMNLLTRHADPKLDIDAGFIKIIIFAAILMVGLAALSLYIDWSAFKVFMCVIAGLMLAYYGYHFFVAWKTASNELIIQMVLDVLLIIWFVFILFLDIMRTR